MIEKQNWEILSLTRFLLALIVMLDHLSYYENIGFLKWYTYLGSFEAILGFLLISGLSIGKSIQKNKSNYIKRRIQRIYPVYLVSILFQIFLGFNFNFVAIIMLLTNIIFLNQVLINASFVAPAWTLTLEVWLYMLAPVLSKMGQNNIYKIIFASFFCYILYTCGRSLFHWNYYAGTKFGINIILLSFIWVAGFALAIFPDAQKKYSAIIALLLAAHLALTITIQIVSRFKHQNLDKILHYDIINFIGQFFCLTYVYIVVIYNTKISPFKVITNRLFTLLGNISYPLYLTHVTTIIFLVRLKIHNPIIMATSTLVISYLIYLIFDFYSKKRLVTTSTIKSPDLLT